jgi:tetratricopeptide (TPR) repeat protein
MHIRVKHVFITSLMFLLSCNNQTKITELRKQAEAAYQKREVQKAINLYQEVIGLDGKNSNDYCSLANCFDDLGNTQQALENYAKSIELNPKSSEPYYHRGLLYRRTKKIDKAIEDFSKTIELDPQDYGAYYNRGMLYYVKNEVPAAISDLEDAIRINPNYKEAISALRQIRN